MRFDTNWIPARIAATRDLTPAVREFTLHPECGAKSYPTGAHLRVRVTVNGQPDIRHYSLIGAPRDGAWRIAVKREAPGRGGSRHMWSLKPGDQLNVSMPDSHFELAANASAYLLIAGGIGITPIYGMAEALHRRGENFRFLYAGRSRSEMAFHDELRATFGDGAEIFADDEGKKLDLAAAFAGLPPDGEAYICGPIGLLDAAKKAWAAAGRPRARLRFETFGSSGRYENAPFIARIPRLNLDIAVPANTTLLDALEAHGVAVLADCRRGECGLCAMDIVGADTPIDHRDVFFSEKQHNENRKLCACVSRAVGGILTLDPAYRGDPVLTA
jgi:vanillate O-demethylase ferredoxin subunit